VGAALKHGEGLHIGILYQLEIMRAGFVRHAPEVVLHALAGDIRPAHLGAPPLAFVDTIVGLQVRRERVAFREPELQIPFAS
jgi:hypothetical protein